MNFLYLCALNLRRVVAKVKLSELIVSKRIVLILAAVAVAIVCALLIPRTNINTDMARYLPNDSQMKQGIDRMGEEFGEDGQGTGMVRVMFWSLPDSQKVAVKNELSDVDGVSSVLYQGGSREYNNGDKVLYELLCSSQRSQLDIADDITHKYGKKVVVETSEKGNTAPVGVIMIAFVLLLIVLFIMCESWLEPPIFLAAIGVAVAINMGTNALLNSVSATTNSIAAILQLVLSIDYSIILMNHYRLEKALGNNDKFKDMANAINKASSSIVSSAFTTIVGLMALVFMKFKIGADMGIVLAKGVLCSLLSIFAVLPTLVLALDGAIEKSKKWVPKFKTERLAGFSVKFSVPLTILFVALFVGAYILHKKTVLSFVPVQKSEIAKYFPQKNIIVLLYDNSDSTRVIELADSLTANPRVKSFVSYPSLMQKQHTAADIKSIIGEFSSTAGFSDYNLADYDMNTIVDAIYYLSSHNPNDERMTLHEFAQLAAEVSSNSDLFAQLGIPLQISENDAQYLELLVKLTDTGLIDSMMTTREISNIIGIDQEQLSLLCPEGHKISIREIVKSAKELLLESMAPAPQKTKTPEPKPVEPKKERTDTDVLEQMKDVVEPAENADYSNEDDLIFRDSTIFLRQYTAAEIADLVGIGEKSASIIFNMYGRSTDKKTKTMSLYDFIHFMNTDLVHRRAFASRISEENRKLLKQREETMLSVLHPGEPVIVEEVVVPDLEDVVTDPLAEIPDTYEEPEPVSVMPTVDKENLDALQKAEAIMDIATNGTIFGAAEMCTLLNNFGAKMGLNEIELAYMFYGITHFDDDSVRLSAEDLLGVLNDSIVDNPRFVAMVNDEMRAGVDNINTLIVENLGRLHGQKYSRAILLTDLPVESEETRLFVENLAALCDANLDGSHYLIGESVMMDEMSNQFSGEMLLVTLITVLSIFLIVAIAFRSFAVPAILVMTVMTAVYINVAVSGLLGHLLYLAYLIMQSILMGATIDYGILFTNNYREARASLKKIDSVRRAYVSSTHTILTSGMIMTLAPFVMSLMMDDATIAMILRCIAAGALAALVLIIFVLPGLLVTSDRFVAHKRHDSQ